MMLNSWFSERKIQSVLRVAGALFLALGGYMAVMVSRAGFAMVESATRHDWLLFSVSLGMVIFFLPFTIFLIYAGWSHARRPERASPRLLLIAAFLLLYS